MPPGNGPWFFAPPAEWSDDEVTLPGDESHHALRVLRVEPSTPITITDGAGGIARCVVDRVEQGVVVAAVVEREGRLPARPAVAVYQGAAKGSKNDTVVERLAQLGAVEVRVFASRRAVVRWDPAKAARRAERWAAVARAAAKQSRNPFVVVTGAPLTWAELVRRIEREPRAIVLWEEAERPLRAALEEAPAAERIALVVGPEGGFAAGEANELAGAGARIVSLGGSILRTEDAPVVATAALQYHFGLLG